MPEGGIPCVRKMAIADCFSVTVIIRVEIRLIDATKLMKNITTNSIFFSNSTALKYDWLLNVQSRAHTRSAASAGRSLGTTAGAFCGSASFRRRPAKPPSKR